MRCPDQAFCHVDPRTCKRLFAQDRCPKDIQRCEYFDGCMKYKKGNCDGSCSVPTKA